MVFWLSKKQNFRPFQTFFMQKIYPHQWSKLPKETIVKNECKESFKSCKIPPKGLTSLETLSLFMRHFFSYSCQNNQLQFDTQSIHDDPPPPLRKFSENSSNLVQINVPNIWVQVETHISCSRLFQKYQLEFQQACWWMWKNEGTSWTDC